MAKEKEINKRRRRIAEKIYAKMIAIRWQSPVEHSAYAAASCEAADALMHEFDERGWQ